MLQAVACLLGLGFVTATFADAYRDLWKGFLWPEAAWNLKYVVTPALAMLLLSAAVGVVTTS